MHPAEILKSIKRQKPRNKDFKEIHTLHISELVHLYHADTGIYHYRLSCKMPMYHKFFRNIKTVIIYATPLTICWYFDMKTPCYQTTLTLSPFIAQSDRYLFKKISQLERQNDGDWATHEEKIIDFEALLERVHLFNLLSSVKESTQKSIRAALS